MATAHISARPTIKPNEAISPKDIDQASNPARSPRLSQVFPERQIFHEGSGRTHPGSKKLGNS